MRVERGDEGLGGGQLGRGGKGKKRGERRGGERGGEEG